MAWGGGGGGGVRLLLVCTEKGAGGVRYKLNLKSVVARTCREGEEREKSRKKNFKS